MAQQLDFSPLDNRAEIYRDKAMRQQITQNLIDKTAKGIFDVVDWQRDMRQQFAEASEFDSDITMDAQINSYAAKRYEEKLREPAIEAIMNKKFKNQSHINKMNAVQRQMGREVSSLKAASKLRMDAEQKAESNPMLFEFDKEAAADFNNFLMGNTDVKNVNAYMTRFSGQDGAPPFLKVRVHNPDKYIPSAALSLRDEYSVIKEEAKKKIVGDNMVTTTKQQKVIDDVAKEAFGSMVFSKMMQDTQYKQLWGGFGKYLENKNNTEGNGSAGPIADIENYITNYNYSDIFEPRTTKESIKTEPVKEEKDKKDTRMRLNFTGDDGTDYDSNRTDFSVQGVQYKDAFTFPESKTKERIDVIKGGQQIIGGEKRESKDITDVGRLVLYDMNKDVILIQDKNGRYYEAPRKDNEVVLRKLIHGDDYTKILDYQLEKKESKKGDIDKTASRFKKIFGGGKSEKNPDTYDLNGESFTKQELTDAGWTEDDLKKL